MDNISNKLKLKIYNIMSKIKKYIPNTLTTLRLIAVPFFWANFLKENFLVSTFIFASACITDAFDGFLAKKWKVQSNYGKIMDPLADKSIVLSSLILYTIKYSKLMLIPIVLESLIALTNIISCLKNINFSELKNLNMKDKLNYIIKKGKVGVYEIGRKKTIFLMVTASLSVLNTSLSTSIESIINTLLLITASLEVCTLSSYIYNKLIKNENEEKDIEKTEFIIEENKKDLSKEKTETKKENLEKLKKELNFLNESNNKSNIKQKTLKK